MTHAARTHSRLRPGDILLGDGLFGGCGHLMQLVGQKLDGLFPKHHSRTIGWGKNAQYGRNRRFVRSLGWFDQLVEYRKPDKKPKWMTAKEYRDAPEWLLVREIRREVKIGGARKYVTVVTTLLGPKTYPAKELVKLLGERWAIEVDLRSLKTTMGMESLRCQSVEGVKKELLMYLIVYNLVRLLMLEAAARQGVAFSRVSFADALACMRYGTGEVVALKRLVDDEQAKPRCRLDETRQELPDLGHLLTIEVLGPWYKWPRWNTSTADPALVDRGGGQTCNDERQWRWQR